MVFDSKEDASAHKPPQTPDVYGGCDVTQVEISRWAGGEARYRLTRQARDRLPKSG